MSIMTVSSPAATGVLGHRPNSAPSFFGEPTQIWINDTTSNGVSNLADFGDRLASIAAADVVQLVVRFVRDAGSTRVSHSVDDDYNLVVLNAIALPAMEERVDVDDEIDVEEPNTVDVIGSLVKHLGVSERLIEQATGISHSTHAHWKRNPAVRPRAGSEGGLWSLMAIVDDLAAYLGDRKTIAAWLKEDGARKDALKRGMLRRLVDQETGALRTAASAIVTLDLSEDRDALTSNDGSESQESEASRSESWSLDDPAPRIVLD